MATNTYAVNGMVYRRSTKQGRKPQGLAKPQVIRLDDDLKQKLDVLSEYFGYLWNENQFIRDAVRDKLNNSVYTELLKS